MIELEKGKRNIIELLERAAQKYADFKYASHKTERGWVSYTYSQINALSDYLSAALLEIGLKKGDKAAILSEGSPQWIISEYSLLKIGVISVPLSVKLLPEELPFRLDHSECVALFVSKNSLSKVMEVAAGLKDCRMKLIYLDSDIGHFFDQLESNGLGRDRGFTFWELLDRGKKLFESDPSGVTDLKKGISENDIVNISYTSGTTGNPKGIMLSHLNYYSNAKDGIDSFGLKEGFRTLVILPVDHSFAHTVALYGALFKALDLYFLDARGGTSNALKNIPINLKEVRPEFLLTVPALSANFMNKMKEGISQKGRQIDALFRAGLKAGISRNGDGHGRVSFWIKVRTFVPHVLASALIFKKLRNVFGGEIKYLVGGGALLDIKQQQFFRAIGSPIFQGYGLTEAAPIISSNTPMERKMGTSGKVMPSISCRIMKEKLHEAMPGEIGEIVIKGDNIMKGYYKNAAATAEVIIDDWLWTGDLGYLDKDGFLVVTGRNKALLISEDGEKYSPEGIEEAIVSSTELLGQAMVFNEQKKYTTAIVTIDPLKVSRLRSLKKEDALDLIKKDVERFKKDPAYAGQFPSKWLPSYFFIAPEPFSESNKMVNSTMKMVRHKIIERHRVEIEQLYQPAASKVSDELNLQSLGAILN
ncbi:MAG: AMP-binding protein [Vicingaceae bacterium]